VSYARGAIQRRRPPNLTKGQREYRGPCEGGCGQEIHTVGDPPRRLCVGCVGKRGGGTPLPEGRTCSECQNFRRCSWYLLCKPDSRTCDWDPSRFAAAQDGGRT
jgi:hypothetical protein